MTLFTELVWSARIAWRDGRRSLRALLLLAGSIIAGVAALTSLSSFKQNLETAIDANSKPLLGADLAVHARRPFDEATEQLFERIGGEQSRELTFASMAYFPVNGGSRLVQVDALEGEFPYYGELETTPPEAAKRFRKDGTVLVDRSVLIQFGAKPGETVKIGEATFTIAGALEKVPGVIDARSSIAPRIFMSLRRLPETKLITRGSRVRYKQYFKFEDEAKLSAVLAEYENKLRASGLGVDTVAEKRETIGKVLKNAYLFLDLIGFIALILGGLGVGSAAHVYIRKKVMAISVFRCLGAKTWQTSLVFLFQIGALGGISTLIGAGIGIWVQRYLPELLSAYLPVDVAFSIDWPSVAEATGMSFALLLLFSLGPLASVRAVPPLAALRVHIAEHVERDRAHYLIWALIVASSALFAMRHGGDARAGGIFTLVLFGAAAILALVGMVLRAGVRRFLPEETPYALRQGLANLYRPYNQTVLLVVAVGMAIFLSLLVVFSQASVLEKARLVSSGDRPNMILFDIQSDQLPQIRSFLEEQEVVLYDSVPMVSMRLTAVKGRSTASLRTDPASTIPGWVLTREYRSTYRGALSDTEELRAGTFIGRASPETPVVPVSIEQRIAEDLALGLGDRLTFDVQGVPLEAEVTSIREVDWQRLQPNFFMVFPEGILEDAPQFFIVAAKVSSDAHSAAVQRATVNRFPNVSIIDFSLMLKTLDTVVERLIQVVQFMGMFSLLTAGVVLFAAVTASRRQRIRENALLKTLGASWRTVVAITAWEYLTLGAIAATSGTALAAVCGWVLARFAFETPYVTTFGPALWTAVAGIVLTALLGVSGSRGTYRRPAIEVLREEE
ncbi:MAG: ABC transporter permease [Bdellovibrionales bacterium]|nr:ABC transporter permease [Bdellovibrionales bacterium]